MRGIKNKPKHSLSVHGTDLSSLKQLRTAALKAAKEHEAAKAAQALLAAQADALLAAKTNIDASTALATADINLFRQAMKTVTPIQSNQHVMTATIPLATAQMLHERRQHATGTNPLPAITVSDHYAAAHTDQDDRRFIRSPHAGDILKGLKRGKWPIQASLDLHGATLDQARARLDQFLQSCLEHQVRSVRIVHGKGYGSRDAKPVLKDVVRRWLTQLSAVAAYIECLEADGGAGAVHVLLSVPNQVKARHD